MVKTAAYDDSGADLASWRSQRSLFEGEACALGKFSLSSAIAFPDATVLRWLCSGEAGLGITGQTLVNGQSWCDMSPLPPKSSIAPFKASRSAKAACDKVKDVLAGASLAGVAPAKMQQRRNVSTAPASVFAINCTASWKATVSTPNKVGLAKGRATCLPPARETAPDMPPRPAHACPC